MSHDYSGGELISFLQDDALTASCSVQPQVLPSVMSPLILVRSSIICVSTCQKWRFCSLPCERPRTIELGPTPWVE